MLKLLKKKLVVYFVYNSLEIRIAVKYKVDKQCLVYQLHK